MFILFYILLFFLHPTLSLSLTLLSWFEYSESLSGYFGYWQMRHLAMGYADL